MRILVLLFFLQVSAFGATIYCSPAGGGSGADFNNLATLPNTTGFDRANTYVFIEGSYGARTFSEPVSGTTVITVRMANAAQDSGVAGYASTLHDGVAAFGHIQSNTGYWIVDGIKGGGPANDKTTWTTGYGIEITDTTGAIVQTSHPTGTFVLRHFKTIGAGNDGNGTANDSIFGGHDTSASATFEYGYLTQAGRCHYYHGDGPMTSSWVYAAQYESTAGEHSEFAVIRSSDLFVFRWGVITHEEGTGGFISANDTDGRDGPNGTSTAELYGNIFYESGEFGAWDTAINGFIASFTLDAFTRNWKVYNNTFIGLNPSCYGESGESPLGNLSKNNYYYDSGDHTVDSGWTQTHGHFQSSGSTSGSNATSGTGDPFEDFTNYDFRLGADTTAGDTSLGSPYDVDMFGNRYDLNGGWTRGAIAFNSLSSGLVSHWHFEDAATGPWIDDHGANDFTLSSGTAFSNTGKINNAIDFDASSVAIVQVADNASFGFTTAFSVSVWVFPETITANMGILGKWNYNTDGGWVLQTDGVTGDGFMAFIARTAADGGNTWLRWNSWGTMNAATWYHAVLVYDGSQTGDDNRLKLYVNGTLTLSTAQGSPEVPASLVADTAPLRVGMFGTGLARHFNGRIDEVRLWNRVLTSDEVTELYTLENGGEGGGAVTVTVKQSGGRKQRGGRRTL